MNSKTNHLSQKSHQWSNDELYLLRCDLLQGSHHFGRLNVDQILAGPPSHFTPFETSIPLVHLSLTYLLTYSKPRLTP